MRSAASRRYAPLRSLSPVFDRPFGGARRHLTRMAEGWTSVRKLPFPISMPSGRVGRGHLLPDLSLVGKPKDFVRVPGGRRVRYGMLGFVGSGVSALDMLERWAREVGPVADQGEALARLRAYVDEVARLKIGNVVEIEYSQQGMPRLTKVSDTPPVQFKPRLPT